jgi:hypothetical protein
MNALSLCSLHSQLLISLLKARTNFDKKIVRCYYGVYKFQSCLHIKVATVIKIQNWFHWSHFPHAGF